MARTNDTSQLLRSEPVITHLAASYTAMKQIAGVVGMFTYQADDGVMLLHPLAQSHWQFRGTYTIVMQDERKNEPGRVTLSHSLDNTFFEGLYAGACGPSLVRLYEATMNVQEAVGGKVGLNIFPSQQGIMMVRVHEEEWNYLIDLPVDWRMLNRRYPLGGKDTW